MLLCWLALLLVRLVEVKTGLSWAKARSEMNRMHLVELKGSHGHVLKRTELTDEQRSILKKMEIKPPCQIERITPANTATSLSLL